MLRIQKSVALNQAYLYPHQKWVDACRQGDRAAQYYIYKQYAKAMFNVSMRILNDQAEAEDVLQEAFLDAFQKIDSFQGEATFGAWLKRIVVNRSINQLRKRKEQSSPLDEQAEVPDEPTPDEDDLALEVEKVHRAMALLPDGFRTVLSLYLIEGYDHAEIAQILQVTTSTSKSQLNRAKKKLLEILKSL
ncbi:RNA polymerase sigma factor [Eisenibacter elegans]|uniref:RNA polymerase sigma factor n=1 Tax=Eisenibacter elegans TaxID=997 RepID=UPI00047C6BC4|nr:sigma-70 family RNA polymerase sigma factor [Eisenibacter elegans]